MKKMNSNLIFSRGKISRIKRVLLYWIIITSQLISTASADVKSSHETTATTQSNNVSWNVVLQDVTDTISGMAKEINEMATEGFVNNIFKSYRIDKWKNIDIKEFWDNYTVTSNCMIDYFIPTKTKKEWAAFRMNKPACIALTIIPDLPQCKYWEDVGNCVLK